MPDTEPRISSDSMLVISGGEGYIDFRVGESKVAISILNCIYISFFSRRPFYQALSLPSSSFSLFRTIFAHCHFHYFTFHFLTCSRFRGHLNVIVASVAIAGERGSKWQLLENYPHCMSWSVKVESNSWLYVVTICWDSG